MALEYKVEIDNGYVKVGRALGLDKDGNVVDPESPESVELLCGSGGMLPKDLAEKYGLLKKDEPKAKAKKPAANKMAKPSEDK